MDKYKLFRLYLVVEKGLSELSASAYIKDLQTFEECTSISCESVTFESLTTYLKKLREKNYAPSSIARMVVSLRVFQKYLLITGKKTKGTDLFLDTPKCYKLIPEILSEAEVLKLLEGDELTAPAIALEVIYACGLRVSEVCSLNCFDMGKDTLFVKGKGGRERVVPIATKTKLRVLDYLDLERRNKCKEDPLFVNEKGKRITRQEIWSEIKDLAVQKGIQKNISPHMLRHSYATHMLDRGADLRVIQELLGHKSITTTEIYTHTSKQKLKESFSNCHPLEGE